MTIQERPVCFNPRCQERILNNDELLFEAPCGHEDCPSASFHPLCLMEWREHRENLEREIKRFIARHEEANRHDDE